MSGYVIKSASRDHYPFVYNSFLKSYRETWPNSDIPKTDYFSKFHRVLEYFLENGECRIAVSSDDEDHILGWSLTFGKNLVYVYVKQLYRGLGIGTALLGKAGEYYVNFATKRWCDMAARLELLGFSFRVSVLDYDELICESEKGDIHALREKEEEKREEIACPEKHLPITNARCCAST